MRLGVRAALVDGELVDGDLDVEDGVITRLGVTPAGAEGVAVPGFVDLHINGVAGVDFLTADPEGYRRRARRSPGPASSPISRRSCRPTPARLRRAAPRGREAAASEGAGDLPLVMGVHLEAPSSPCGSGRGPVTRRTCASPISRSPSGSWTRPRHDDDARARAARRASS